MSERVRECVGGVVWVHMVWVCVWCMCGVCKCVVCVHTCMCVFHVNVSVVCEHTLYVCKCV